MVKTLKNLHLTQIVNFITRPVSKACLDHICVSHPDRIQNTAFSRDIGLSDHLPIFINRRFKTNNKESPNHRTNHLSIEYRNLKNLNETEFVKDLNAAPWDVPFVFETTDDVTDSWYAIFNEILDKHAPLKQKRIKRKTQPKWFDNEINNKAIYTGQNKPRLK